MNTLESDAEIMADGSLKLLSPLPAWVIPGRAHVLLTVESAQSITKAKRQKLTASPEMIAERMSALEAIRKLDPYREITDPVAWQKEIRADRSQPDHQ